MKKYLFFACLVASSHLFAQETPIKKMYSAFGGETIFSWGNVEAQGLNTKDIVRFTIFLHLNQQFHYDFSKKAGFFTGISLRNVGIITDLNDTVRVKQRVYTLGVPVGIKLGNMHGTNVALGAEGELAIHYKQKNFVNGEKGRTTEWFSDRTNLFLPSVFAQLNFKDGFYLKYKYYLTDFLVADAQRTNVNGLLYQPTKSQMMYVSFGVMVPTKKIKSQTKTLM
jgi:hypothetical protein